MKIAGIVAEYDPFHRGHAYHIEKTRERTGCDWVIACMAGHFTQRGEPAMFSKWDRARMALSCGVDAVFELPALFAVRSADAFAQGGVGVLGGLGVDVLSFGCETEDIELLDRLAELREKEPPQLSHAIQRRLDGGMSHVRAWGEAVGERLGLSAEELNRPNMALAVEYLRVLRRQFPDVEPLAVRRVGNYHEQSLMEYASATAIRAAFQRGEREAALAAIPENARQWAHPEPMHEMDDMLLYRLRDMDPDALLALPDVGEGLEHRLAKLAAQAPGREALLEALKCRRYTRARLSRMLTHALLHVTREALELVPSPPYARLIGLRVGAEPVLRALKMRASLPIIADPVSLREDPCFVAECRATDVWSLLHDDPALRAIGREFRERFVRVP